MTTTHRVELPYMGLARSLSREHGLEPLEVEGELPEDLAGVMYRNGPAVFETVEGQRYPHLFDGDGAITMVRFADGRARGAVRVVQTPELRWERARGRVRMGGYGVISRRPIRDFFLRGPKNVANTSVMRWQSQLLALWEGGLPTALDPETLETRGPTRLGGVVPRSLSAHPHRVPARRCSYNFGVRYGRVTRLDLFELPDQGPARRLLTLPLAGPTMVHDFAVTARHLIICAPPLRLDLKALMLGRRAFSDALRWMPEAGTEVIVVPIDAPESARRMTVEPFYQWHFANAFERGDELVLDLVRYPDFGTNRWLKRLFNGLPVGPTTAEYGRITIKGERFDYTTVLDHSTEFPIVAPSAEAERHRYTWMVAHSTRAVSGQMPHDTLMRFDYESGEQRVWAPGPGHFPSEPLFAPRPGARAEDDGWLLTLNYAADRDRSYVEVLDAADPRRGPLARAWFDHAIPQSFHGRWYPG